jgi:arylsulfatase A-like enzyme
MNSKNTPSTRPHAWLFLVVAAFLLLAGVGAFTWYRLTRATQDLDGEPTDQQAVSTRLPNIILVVVDTERADFTSPYGADPELTPTLSRLAQEGILFTNAFAPGPWTVPSMFSLMTGVYPSEHGITRGVVRDAQNLDFQPVLSPSATTIAEHLKSAGYRTFAVNTNLHMSPQSGMPQGFDRYVGDTFHKLPFPNDQVRLLTGEIKAEDSPFFLWVHYFDPHYPYRQRQPHFDRWNPGGIRTYEEVASLVDWKTLGLDPTVLFRLSGAKSGDRMRWFDYFNSQLPKPGPSTERRILDFWTASYKSEIAATDRAIARMITQLAPDPNTIIVYVSDHGEEFFEHGQLTHTLDLMHLYQQLVHVPFVVRLPHGEHAGRVVTEPVSLVDVLPTLLSLIGQPAPEKTSGVSLLPLMRGESLPKRPLYSEVTLGDETARAIVEFPWKLIHKFKAGTSELYNLETDPGEQTNLAETRADIKAPLEQRLLQWAKDTKPLWSEEKPAELSPEAIEQLRAMGYMDNE